MKILHINSYYSGSKFYKKLYDQQVKNGLDIDVFVPVSSAYKDLEANFGSYTTLSVNHTNYDRVVFHLKHHKIYKDIVNKYNINKYSVVHAHSLFSNGYIAMKMKKQFGVPYLAAVRNTDVNIFFKKMIHLRKMGVQILKNADQVIFLSKVYRDEVIEKYVPGNLKERIFNKTSIIPNGIDDFWLNNRGDIKPIPNKNDLKLLYVGVINKNKNITTTIKAIDLLLKQGIKAKLTVVGQIKDQSIYDQIKNSDYVQYIEPKHKEELLKIYRQNDIFVMPSIYETFGLVYAEAMSQGLPVIYTRGQGFDGQFEDGKVGFSVKHDATNEIVDRVKDVLKNYNTLSENCISNVDRYMWEKITQEYSTLYNNLN